MIKKYSPTGLPKIGEEAVDRYFPTAAKKFQNARCRERLVLLQRAHRRLSFAPVSSFGGRV